MLNRYRNEAPQVSLPNAGQRSPAGEYRGLLLASLLMCVSGWGGLAWLVLNTVPRIGGEIWLFFLLLHLGVTGTAIPLLRWLSLRLAPAAAAPPAGVILRRAVWIGIIAVICAWLLIPRYLSLPIALVMLLLFLALELFLRNRELAHERNA